MLSDQTKELLIKTAKKTLTNNYALNNNGNYAAAVLTSTGNMYQGISYFSDTYTLTTHGEQAALIHAAAHGEYKIVAIAIVSSEEKPKGEFTNPCHLCKQLLYETSKRNNLPLTIYLTNNHQEVKEIQLADIISFPWPA